MGNILETFDVTLTKEQMEMFKMECPFPLFVGGYGSGKSQTLVWNAINDLFMFPGAKVGIYAPTYDLLDLNLIPRFEEIFQEMDVGYTLNKSRYIMYVHGRGQLIFRSMQYPGRIVAYEVFRSHVDEADLLPQDKAGEVWDRIIARNRQASPLGVINQVRAYSTPESFQFTYNRWSKNPGEGYKYVRVPTYSNPWLPDTYVKNLRDSYSPELCEAYIEGKWVNIYTGNVYPYFDRNEHHIDEVVEPGDVLYLSQDFNVGGCVTIVYKLIEGGWPVAVDEFVSDDTEQIIHNTRQKYGNHKVVFYPDATGQRRDTRSGSTDILMLQQAGFKVRVPRVNPFVKDRVNAVNRLLMKKLLRVNTRTCKELTSALEEHAWDIKTGAPQKYGEAASVDDYTDAMGYFIAYEYPVKKFEVATTKIIGV